MKYGSADIKNVMVGTTQINRIMYGVDVIWENIVWFEDVVYDNTNIYDEFHILVDAETISTDTLVATDYDGYGIALDITDGATVLVGIDKIEIDLEFENISTSTAADILTTFAPIQDGDNLVIVKNDDSINELVASGVVPAETTVVNGTFDNDLHGWILGTGIITWKPNYIEINRNGGNIVTAGAKQLVTWPEGTEVTFTADIISATQNGTLIITNDSNATLERVDSSGIGSISLTYTVGAGNEYLVLNGQGTNASVTASFDNVSDGLSAMSSMDTSLVTAGEIPSRVYTVDAQPSFAISAGYINAVKLTDSYLFNGGLGTTRTYSKMLDDTGSLTLSPKVILKSIGDKMTRMIFTTLK